MSLLSIHRQGLGPRLVWLHGFTQTHASAHQFKSILAGTHCIETLDLPGHGDSAHIAASLDETADILGRSLDGGPFVLGGYSMGSRVALHFALQFPERLHGLVLLGSTRGMTSSSERQQRRERDAQLADEIEAEGTELFLTKWLSQPMFQTLPLDEIERATRSKDSHGLAMSLRLSGTGTQSWLGDRVKELYVPTLAMAGALDTKFCAEAEALAETMPNAGLHLIPGAQHAAHLEKPHEVAAAISNFTKQF